MQRLLSLFRTRKLRYVFTHLPNELLLEIASHLQRLRDLNAHLRVSRHLADVLSPVLARRGVTAVDRYSQRSLVQWAAANGRSELLARLLSHGADVNSRAAETTALHSGVLSAQLDSVAVLLAHGADMEVVNNDGWTPLHMAAITGNRDVADLLLEYGADIEAPGTNVLRKSALDYACLRGHRGVAEMLLERGADNGVKKWGEMTLAQGTALAGYPDIARLVLMPGEDGRDVVSAADGRIFLSLLNLQLWHIDTNTRYYMRVEQRHSRFRV